MTPWAALAIFAAGLAAGTINVIVGSGSLITFPTLLASATRRSWPTCPTTSAWSPAAPVRVVAYRRELDGQRSRLLTLGAASLSGGITGAVLLLALPSSVFKAAVPALVLSPPCSWPCSPGSAPGWPARGERQVHGARCC